MRKVIFNNLDPRGKFTPNYEGPYIVKKVLLGGALIFVDIAGIELAYFVNADVVKIFYQWNEDKHSRKDLDHFRTCAYHAYHAYHEFYKHIYLFCRKKQKESEPVDGFKIPNEVVK